MARQLGHRVFELGREELEKDLLRIEVVFKALGKQV